MVHPGKPAASHQYREYIKVCLLPFVHSSLRSLVCLLFCGGFLKHQREDTEDAASCFWHMGGSDALAVTTELTLATQTTCLNINIQTLLCITKDRQTKNTSLKPTASEGFSSPHTVTARLSPATEQQTTAASLCSFTNYCSKAKLSSGQGYTTNVSTTNSSAAVSQCCQKLVKYIHYS